MLCRRDGVWAGLSLCALGLRGAFGHQRSWRSRRWCPWLKRVDSHSVASAEDNYALHSRPSCRLACNLCAGHGSVSLDFRNQCTTGARSSVELTALHRPATEPGYLERRAEWQKQIFGKSKTKKICVCSGKARVDRVLNGEEKRAMVDDAWLGQVPN